jgi:hypothetical protein
LHHEKQHRVHDADERHEAGTDRHEHLGRLARRDRRTHGNPRDDHAERDSAGDIDQLDDPGAQPTPRLQRTANPPRPSTKARRSRHDCRIDLSIG